MFSLLVDSERTLSLLKHNVIVSSEVLTCIHLVN